MKIDFSRVIFIDESQVTFDEPYELVKGWILSNSDMPVSKRGQQGGGSVMIRTRIVYPTIIGPFKVNESVQINSENNSDFMDKTFFSSCKSQSHSFKVQFRHENTPHVVKLTHEFFKHQRFT